MGPDQTRFVLLLVVLSLSRQVLGDCSSACTSTSFRSYASCLTQRCGTNVAVTTCDCPATNCQLCPGDGRCCQTCCSLSQCDCSAVVCQPGCTTACCLWCCQVAPCQQPCASQPCSSQPCSSQPCSSQPCASQPCSSQPCASQPCSNQPCASQPCASQPSTTVAPPCPTSSPTNSNSTTTTTLPSVSNPIVFPPPSTPSPQQPTLPPQPLTPVINITMPNITLYPFNVSFTPHITVVVNTSPVSQVYATQYGGNATATVLPGAAQAPVNCSSEERRCCRVVVVPRNSCTPGYNCLPVQRVACGPQCASLLQQAVRYPPTWPYYYQPRPVYYPPQYFCANGCVPMPTWPFLDCSGALQPTPMGAGFSGSAVPAGPGAPLPYGRGVPPGSTVNNLQGATYLGTLQLPPFVSTNITSQ